MGLTITRRKFLEASLLAGTTGGVATRLAFAHAATESIFVFVLLRGALDGLAAVPPVGDPHYASLRGQIALATSGADAALPLDDTFALHPALRFLRASYQSRELTVLHAVASPYRERSHFDGQNVLENGGLRPDDTKSGWLNRAIANLPTETARQGGVALGANVPLAMRGPAAVASWSPTRTEALDDETLMRITDLYASDPLLSVRLAEALQSDAIARTSSAAALDEAATRTVVERDVQKHSSFALRFMETARAAGAFLRREDGPRIAMFDSSGWDTHANEGGAQGQLAARLRGLDTALSELKNSLGPAWSRTVVLVATEFGRTAAINGTRGTDHGTGAAAFLLGGSVAGGRVRADWPGLSPASLYQGRDLHPTCDLRAVMKGVLCDHLSVATAALDNSIFPDSRAVQPLPGLVRG